MRQETDNNGTQDLIELTVDRVVEYFHQPEHHCYLLADETGIGKTIEAREIIKKMSCDKKEYKVLYIASNQLLASENIKKLVHKDLKPYTEIISEDRLSIYQIPENGLEDEKNKSIKYFAVTPAVSFYLEGGTEKEIQKCNDLKNIIEEQLEIESEKKDIYINIIERIESIEQISAPLKTTCYKNDMYTGIKDFVNNEKIAVKAVCIEEDKKVIFDEVFNVINIKKNLIHNVLKPIVPFLYEELVKEYDEEKTDESVRIFEKKIEDAIIYGPAIDLYVFAGQVISNERIWKQKNEAVYNEAEALRKKQQEKFDGRPADFYCYFAKNFPSIKNNYIHLIKAYESMKDNVFNLINVEKLEGYKRTVEFDKETFEKILWKNQDNLLMDCIEGVLSDLYKKKKEQQLRLLGTLWGIENYQPDLVILDEFQNYPKLFTHRAEDDNEDTQNLEKIMTAALKNKNSKVLMLSATPYAYRNMIMDDGYGTDEEDGFLQHVGIDDIISYMNERNGQTVDFRDLYKKYRHSIDRILQNSETVSQDDEDSPEKAAKEISDTLYELGISRNERPQAGYSGNGDGIGSILLDPKKITDEEIICKIEGTSEKARDVRRFLSTPVYYFKEEKDEKDKDDNKNNNIRLCTFRSDDLLPEGYSLRTRTTALLDDIFPKREGEFIPPIFMASSNCGDGELKGCFDFYKYQDYSKKILFSAYTNVPELIKRIVNEKFEENIKVDESKLDTLKDISKTAESDCFEEYICDCLKNIKVKAGGGQIKKLIDILKEGVIEKVIDILKDIFSSDYAKKILIKVFEKFDDNGNRIAGGQGITKDNYWTKVKTYCEWGNFQAVLDEFCYLYYEEYDNDIDDNVDDIVSYLNDVKDSAIFSQAYTSKSRISETEIRKYKRGFQSPFYPMNFFLSSVAQEGLDFHWYCDFIIHWNVPASPISLLQREGRVNRYNCYSLRKELYKDLKEKKVIDGTENWNDIYDKAEKLFEDEGNIGEELRNNPYSNLFPHHLSLACESLPIQRKCYYYPLSEEHFRWMDLMRNMECYRSLLGAWNIEELESEITDELKERLSKCMIDISPGRII